MSDSNKTPNTGALVITPKSPAVFLGQVFNVFDRVKESTTSTGTGAYTLGGAQTSFIAFSAAPGILNGMNVEYAVSNGTDWEVGNGIYSSSGNTITRNLIYASSNGNEAVNWSSGTKDIWGNAGAYILRALIAGLEHGKSLFTASGSWTCPPGVNKAWISGVAGGGGGAGTSAGSIAGAGGGGGEIANRVAVAVIPGTVYTVTIGTAGTAGTSSPSGAGGTGGTTSFGSLVSLAGGGGGNFTTGADSIVAGGTGGAGNQDGAPAFQFDGALITKVLTGGGGGAGGGKGTVAGGVAGTAGRANSGGGGGGGCNSLGGAGGSGYLIVEW